MFQIISNQFLKLFVTPNVERGKRDTGQTRDTSRAKMKAEKNIAEKFEKQTWILLLNFLQKNVRKSFGNYLGKYLWKSQFNTYKKV